MQHYLVIIVQTLLLIAIGVTAFNIRITGNLFLFWLVLFVNQLNQVKK